MRDFELKTVGPIGDHAVLRVAGEVDVYTAPMLRQQVLDLLSKGVVHVIVDLGGVVFLDSTALGAQVGCLKRLRTHNGSLMLVINTERVLRIFRITGLIRAMPPHDSVADAIGTEEHWRRAVESEAGSIAEWCRRHDLDG